MRTTTHRLLPAAAAALLLAAGPALAQPAEIPIQGTLTDSGGIPLEGNHTLSLSLYTSQSGGEPLFSEIHQVSVDLGAFTSYLGSIDSLDLTLFDGTKLYVGIQVGSDDEMVPRLPLGSVPYAAYAHETAAVPAGAVMHFALESCPAGWAPLAEARGRAIVGLVEAGQLEATVGPPLGDRENRTHTHNVSVPGANTGSSEVTHTHTVPAHNHRWFSNTRTYNSSGSRTVSVTHVNHGGLGGAEGTLSLANTTTYYTDNQAATATGPASSTWHSHTVPSRNNLTSTGASTGDVMPYLQLLTCVKT